LPRKNKGLTPLSLWWFFPSSFAGLSVSACIRFAFSSAATSRFSFLALHQLFSKSMSVVPLPSSPDFTLLLDWLFFPRPACVRPAFFPASFLLDKNSPPAPF